MLNRHSNFVSHSGISPLKRKPRAGGSSVTTATAIRIYIAITLLLFWGPSQAVHAAAHPTPTPSRPGVESLEIRITESLTPLGQTWDRQGGFEAGVRRDCSKVV